MGSGVVRGVMEWPLGSAIKAGCGGGAQGWTVSETHQIKVVDKSSAPIVKCSNRKAIIIVFQNFRWRSFSSRGTVGTSCISLDKTLESILVYQIAGKDLTTSCRKIGQMSHLPCMPINSWLSAGG